MALISQVVLEKKIFENGGRTDEEQTYDRQWLYHKLTKEPKGSGELKTDIQTSKDAQRVIKILAGESSYTKPTGNAKNSTLQCHRALYHCLKTNEKMITSALLLLRT